jgi:sec-independent protein translocase protein TatA
MRNFRVVREAKMGEFSVYHWLIVLFIVVLLFGGRKIPEMMRGIGEGIHAFRKGVSPEEKQVNRSVEASTDSDKK